MTASEASAQVAQIDEPDIVIPEDFDPASVKTVEKAREEAKLPKHKQTSALIDNDIVYVAWRAQTAVLRETGEISHGYFVVCYDPKTKETFTVFVGSKVLTKELAKLTPPFRATVKRDGRVLKFT